MTKVAPILRKMTMETWFTMT